MVRDLVRMLVKVSVWIGILLSGLTFAAMIAGRSRGDALLAFEADRPRNIAIYLADPRFGLAANLTRNAQFNNTEPVWSPDGRLTFVSSALLNQDVYTLTLDQPAPINVSQTTDSYAPVWSADGRLAYVTHHSPEANSIDILNLDGSRQSYTVEPFSGLINMDFPSWLGDHELAFVGGIRSGQVQVFLLNLDDNSLRNLSNMPALSHNDAVGSPDGERVAFVSTDLSRANGEQIVAVWEKASGALVTITHNTGLNSELSWSRDGNRLAFASTLSGNSEIYVWDAQSGALTNVSNDAGVDEFASWGADGTLAFVSNRAGEAGIYTLDPLTLVMQKVYILHGSSFPVWSR